MILAQNVFFPYQHKTQQSLEFFFFKSDKPIHKSCGMIYSMTNISRKLRMNCDQYGTVINLRLHSSLRKGY